MLIFLILVLVAFTVLCTFFVLNHIKSHYVSNSTFEYTLKILNRRLNELESRLNDE